jgi:hypothetical protein
VDEISEEFLGDLLPGEWAVGATNFPMWLTGERLSPRFTYGLRRTSPLELDDRVSYLTRSGAAKSIVGVDRFSRGIFTWRGRALLKLFASRWAVVGASSAGDFVVIRFSKTLATPAGVDIVVRPGVDGHEFRTAVAAAPHDFGLTSEEFAGLTWLELVPKIR